MKCNLKRDLGILGCAVLAIVLWSLRDGDLSAEDLKRLSTIEIVEGLASKNENPNPNFENSDPEMEFLQDMDFWKENKRVSLLIEELKDRGIGVMPDIFEGFSDSRYSYCILQDTIPVHAHTVQEICEAICQGVVDPDRGEILGKFDSYYPFREFVSGYRDNSRFQSRLYDVDGLREWFGRRRTLSQLELQLEIIRDRVVWFGSIEEKSMLSAGTVEKYYSFLRERISELEAEIEVQLRRDNGEQ